MKTIYKILFSICSTIVCTAHSFRAFAASCTIATSYDTTTGVVNEYYEHENTTGCKTYNIQYQLSSEGYAGGEPRKYYNKFTSCTACNTGYTWAQANIDIIEQNDTGGLCTTSAGICKKTSGTSGGNCSTNADCVASYGAAQRITFFPNQDGSVSSIAYAKYIPVCEGSPKACSWKAPFTIVNSSATDADIICTNGHYSDVVTIYSASNGFYVSGCMACPTTPFNLVKEYGTANGLVYNGGGRSVTDCYVTQPDPARTYLQDTTGKFDLLDNCQY